MGQSIFTAQWKRTVSMRPFVALSFILASAFAAPQHIAGVAHAVAPVAGTVSHGVAPNTVGATTHSVGPAPAGAHHYSAGAVVPHPVNYVAPPAPAPFTTATQAAGVTTVHQPAPVVTKQVHLGETSFVSGYATRILKPATPHLPISVPTVLKGSVAYNAPIVKVPTPVHVDAPYNVAVPTPVAGEPIIKRTQAAPVVTHSQHVVDGGVLPAVHAGHVAHGAYAHGAYAAAPAAALLH